MDAASFIAQLANRKLALAAEPELSPETVAAIGGAATALASMRGGDSDEASFREALSKRVKALLKWQRNIKLENTDAAAQPVTISVPGHVAAPAEPSEGLFAAVVCSVALSREAAGSGAQDTTKPLVGSTLDEVGAGLLNIHATGEATAAGAKSAEWRAWVQHLHQVAVGTTSERRPAGLLGEELAAPSADSTAAITSTADALAQLQASEDGGNNQAAAELGAPSPTKSARAETTEAAAEGQTPAAADSTVATASAAQQRAKEEAGELTLQLQRLLRWLRLRKSPTIHVTDVGYVALTEMTLSVILCSVALALGRSPAGPVASRRLEELKVIDTVKAAVASGASATAPALAGTDDKADDRPSQLGSWISFLLDVAGGRTSSRAPSAAAPANVAKPAPQPASTASAAPAAQQPSRVAAATATVTPPAAAQSLDAAVWLTPRFQPETHGISDAEALRVQANAQMVPDETCMLAAYLRCLWSGVASLKHLGLKYNVTNDASGKIAAALRDGVSATSLRRYRASLPARLESVGELVPATRGTTFDRFQQVVFPVGVPVISKGDVHREYFLVVCTLRGEPLFVCNSMTTSPAHGMRPLIDTFYQRQPPQEGVLGTRTMMDSHPSVFAKVRPSDVQLFTGVLSRATALQAFIERYMSRMTLKIGDRTQLGMQIAAHVNAIERLAVLHARMQ